jgi:hypothetical protein
MSRASIRSPTAFSVTIPGRGAGIAAGDAVALVRGELSTPLLIDGVASTVPADVVRPRDDSPAQAINVVARHSTNRIEAKSGTPITISRDPVC